MLRPRVNANGSPSNGPSPNAIPAGLAVPDHMHAAEPDTPLEHYGSGGLMFGTNPVHGHANAPAAEINPMDERSTMGSASASDLPASGAGAAGRRPSAGGLAARRNVNVGEKGISLSGLQGLVGGKGKGKARIRLGK